MRLTISIGPLGMSRPSDVTFHEEQGNVTSLAHGEGQVLQFSLEHCDVSSSFHRALDNGQALAFLKSRKWKLVLEEEK